MLFDPGDYCEREPMAIDTQSIETVRPFGYNGRILFINLTKNTTHIEEPDENWYRQYVGCSPMAAYFLLKEIAAGIDPLSEDNVLVFTVSVVTGAPIAGYSRFTVAAKSPLTGGFGEAEAGGYWGPELKFAGFDAVIIRGRSSNPVYLWIHEGKVEIRDAVNLWGKDNWKTQEQIRKELDDKRIRVASIGPAGEKLVLFANIQHELAHFNGRTGMGAVMGSKNLKAVAVRGKQKVKLADPEKVKEIAKLHSKTIKTHPANINLNKFGTSFLVEVLNHLGILPTRNFKSGDFDGAEKLAADIFHKTVFHSKGTCFACAVKCKRNVEWKDEKYPSHAKMGGPEFESLGALGSLLAIDNLPAVSRANQYCNLMGMDTISAGGVIAFAMECFEEGVISETDTDGYKVRFGDADIMLKLLEDIAERKGFGEILSHGVKKAAKTIGNGAERFAFHIKGQELATHDGRGKVGMAMGCALSATGADHIETPHDTLYTENIDVLKPFGILEPVDPFSTDLAKVKYFIVGQKLWGINNCFGLCNFASVPAHGMTFSRLVEAINAVTGWNVNVHELMRISESANVMTRIFNNRQGFGREDDRVIERWHEKLTKGAAKGRNIDRKDFRKALDLYYVLSGWDSEGHPTDGKLMELNLEWLLTIDKVAEQ